MFLFFEYLIVLALVVSAFMFAFRNGQIDKRDHNEKSLEKDMRKYGFAFIIFLIIYLFLSLY